MGREQIVLAHQAEHPLANPDVATDPKPSPDLAVALALRAMPPGRLRSPPAAPGPRSRASVPDALPAAARRAGRRSWRRTRSGPCPRRRRPAAGRRPDAGRGGGTHRRDLRRPRAEGLRLGLQQYLHGQLSDPLHGAIQFRLTGSPLRCLSEASIPQAFSTCSSRKISTPNWRDRSCTGSSRKSRRTTSRRPVPESCQPIVCSGTCSRLAIWVRPTEAGDCGADWLG